jgi:hypothetical protein
VAVFEPASGGKRGCGRQFCPVCDQEMNHRDERKWFESSSGWGQIFLRDFGHGRFGAADLDYLLERRGIGPSGKPLVMLFEHKEPRAKLEFSQRTILRRLAVVIHTTVLAGELDPQSGVFTVRGHIGGKKSWPRETFFDGEQVIERMLPRESDQAKESWTVGGQDALFRWIDARLGFTPDDRRWRGDS